MRMSGTQDSSCLYGCFNMPVKVSPGKAGGFNCEPLQSGLWTWPLRGHLSHPTGGYFIPTCPNSPAFPLPRPGVYDQDRSRVTEQPPQCCCRRHGFKTGVPAPGRTLEEADITIPYRLHCGRPSWGLSCVMLGGSRRRELPTPLPELSNSGCRPGKAGGSPPFTLDVAYGYGAVALSRESAPVRDRRGLPRVSGCKSVARRLLLSALWSSARLSNAEAAAVVLCRVPVSGLADGRDGASQHQAPADGVVLGGISDDDRQAGDLGAPAPAPTGTSPLRDSVDAAA